MRRNKQDFVPFLGVYSSPDLWKHSQKGFFLDGGEGIRYSRSWIYDGYEAAWPDIWYVIWRMTNLLYAIGYMIDMKQPDQLKIMLWTGLMHSSASSEQEKFSGRSNCYLYVMAWLGSRHGYSMLHPSAPNRAKYILIAQKVCTQQITPSKIPHNRGFSGLFTNS